MGGDRSLEYAFTRWTGVGVYLNATNATICPYDASAFSGIRFRLSAESDDAIVVWQVLTSESPRPERGGSCTTYCNRHYWVQLDLIEAEQAVTFV